jgi:Transposase and inactivated derivatives
MCNTENYSAAHSDLESKYQSVLQENSQLKQRVAWFEKQLFGQKSEKRPVESPDQLSLLGPPTETPPEKEDKVTVTYQRGTANKQRPDNCATDSGLRFSDDVPVEVIEVPAPELQGSDADQYEVIDTQVSHKLAQRPSSYVVLRYETPVVKHKASQTLSTPAMPDQVFEGSIADVSMLVGLLLDKFQFHLPLYRQHQRLAQAGITLSRATLINWVKRSIELLRPIVEAQLANILLSRVLAMDETSIKSGRKSKGKMNTGQFWPIYGDKDEIVFTFATTRGRRHIEAMLKERFSGTLVTDGYAAYARYVETTEGITHAQCWVHGRRKFIEAEGGSPEESEQAIQLIAALYQNERAIEEQSLKGDAKREYRLTHSKPIVDAFFDWADSTLRSSDLTPSNPLGKAINYMRLRESALRTFLEDPDVPLDTNHLERQIRAIPMGRKNWLFCWTELGAEHVGIIQSLISTCKLHNINPHTYLTDVLQRVAVHPAKDVADLTPRVWKEVYGQSPMRSVLDDLKQ